jgi:predicted dinucleotide-binding enzyme
MRDDPRAKEIVFALARDMAFDPVDIWPLKATRAGAVGTVCWGVLSRS